jgi:hypothetical protein
MSLLQERDLEVVAFPRAIPLVKKDGANFALKVAGCQRFGQKCVLQTSNWDKTSETLPAWVTFNIGSYSERTLRRITSSATRPGGEVHESIIGAAAGPRHR